MPGVPIQMQIRQQDLLQGEPDKIPFLCVRGIKEYHDHPAHSGDSWFLHRNNGEGTLHYILDILYKHSIPNIPAFSVNLTPVISFQQQIAIKQ